MIDVFTRRLFMLPVLLLLILCLLSCGPHENAPDAHTRTTTTESVSAKFISIAENAVSTGKVEGTQFAIIEHGEILSTRAFGLSDREKNIPMTVDTPINIASISKPVTAWGLLAFIEHNNITLNASAGELLNDNGLFTQLFSGSEITLQMLLSHTSGLSGASVPVTPATEPLPGLTDILMGNSSVPQAELKRPPGSGFGYSGAGYLLLQKIIEEQTGISFATYMTDTILKPAGMHNSTFLLIPELFPQIAVYYRGDGRRRDSYHLPGAAGGLYSTANDMARFIMLYTNSGDALRKQIISDEALTTMLTPVAKPDIDGIDNSRLNYALGHYTYKTVEETRMVFHAGGNPGLRAYFIVAPDHDIGFFAVTNNDRGSETLAQLVDAWGQHYGLTLIPYF